MWVSNASAICTINTNRLLRGDMVKDSGQYSTAKTNPRPYIFTIFVQTIVVSPLDKNMQQMMSNFKAVSDILCLERRKQPLDRYITWSDPSAMSTMTTNAKCYIGGHFHWLRGATSMSGSHGRQWSIARANASSCSPWRTSSSTCPQLIFASNFSTFGSVLTMLSRSSTISWHKTDAH